MKPSLARAVVYVTALGEALPALVVSVEEDGSTIALSAFCGSLVIGRHGVRYEAQGGPDTWHWPPHMTDATEPHLGAG